MLNKILSESESDDNNLCDTVHRKVNFPIEAII